LPPPVVNRLPVQSRPPAYAPPPPPWKPANAQPAGPAAPPGPPRPPMTSTKAAAKTQPRKPAKGPETRPPVGPPTDRPPLGPDGRWLGRRPGPPGRPLGSDGRPLGPDGRPLTGLDATRPRRRRRGRRMRAILLLVLIGGGAIAYFSWPPARQYPVTANLPDQVADLSLSNGDGAAGRAADRLSQQLQQSDLAGQHAFAGVYADGNGKRVTIFGTTGFRLNPGQDVSAELDHLAGDYDLGDVQSFSLDELGAHEQCGVGRDDGAGVVVCAWADHGSLATVMMTRRNVAESAALTSRLRTAVLTHG
jgi:hypothetical protein